MDRGTFGRMLTERGLTWDSQQRLFMQRGSDGSSTAVSNAQLMTWYDSTLSQGGGGVRGAGAEAPSSGVGDGAAGGQRAAATASSVWDAIHSEHPAV